MLISLAKAALFGLAAGMIACYKGIEVGGGPVGVGNAINRTVVFSFMAFFLIDVDRHRNSREGDCMTAVASAPAARLRRTFRSWSRG